MADAAGYELRAERRDGAATIAIRGRVAIGNAQRLFDDIAAAIPADARRVTLDLSGVDYFDSGGGVVLFQLRQHLQGRDATLALAGTTPDIDGFLSLVNEDAMRTGPPPAHVPSLLEQAGTWGLGFVASLREFTAFAGEVIIGLADAVRHPRQIRWRETWLYMQRAGYEALPIVSLISFLMGLITAFQAAVQLRQFGADIYVASLVGLSVTRELGPLMTAIIAAGRSGAAFAAEIGTMKVSEEVDAMAAMGLDRTRFLVTPKVVALVIMLPLLTLYADLVGIVGGLFVAVVQLNIPAVVYFANMKYYMDFWDVAQGLIKAGVFAFLIALVGCMRGFEAEQGAESVGRITTSAIVSGIFAIILSDAVFTVLFNVW